MYGSDHSNSADDVEHVDDSPEATGANEDFIPDELLPQDDDDFEVELRKCFLRLQFRIVQINLFLLLCEVTTLLCSDDFQFSPIEGQKKETTFKQACMDQGGNPGSETAICQVL